MPSQDMRYLRVNTRTVVVKVPKVAVLEGDQVAFSFSAHGGRENAIRIAQRQRDTFLARAQAPLPSHAVNRIADDLPDAFRKAVSDLYALSKDHPMTVATLGLLAYCAQQPCVSVVGLVEKTGIKRSLLGSNFYGVLLSNGIVEKMEETSCDDVLYPQLYRVTPKANEVLMAYKTCLDTVGVIAAPDMSGKPISPSFIGEFRESVGSTSTIAIPYLICLNAGIVKLWDMQRILGVHVSSISKLIGRLNRGQLLTRIDDPLSGRPYSVINDSGRCVLSRLSAMLESPRR
ncbi:hypothetical protein [Marinobacterium sp. BA1]|uniref:hypothetical protein n=1 Tax=Marinobacterium sp. BA1 TaxID=3138931 RepID=UPI0032E7B265